MSKDIKVNTTKQIRAKKQNKETMNKEQQALGLAFDLRYYLLDCVDNNGHEEGYDIVKRIRNFTEMTEILLRNVKDNESRIIMMLTMLETITEVATDYHKYLVESNGDVDDNFIDAIDACNRWIVNNHE